MANNRGTDKKKAAHDTHGTPFRRVPGPGPKDEGKGAAGKEAEDRLEGGSEGPSDVEADDDGEDERKEDE